MPRYVRVKTVDGTAVRRSRLRLGLTMRELSARCNELGVQVDYSNINRVELYGWGIGARKLPVLAKALGVEVDDLLLPALQAPPATAGKAA